MGTTDTRAVSKRPGIAPPGDAVGAEIHGLMTELFPVLRSLTGDGVRETLHRCAEWAPFELFEVPSGAAALDWTIPDEWTVREAWVAGPDGTRIVDVAESSLALVSYSTPVRARMSLADLRPHLHSLPDRPTLTPYVTSYWDPAWGFCLPHERLEALPEGEYEVVIDTTLAPGHLTYAEAVLPGEIADEILITSWCCHPSLANDNLSGVAVLTALARHIASQPRHHTFRFLLSPGSIGPIAWLAANRERLDRVRHGLVVSCVGDPALPTYKRTRQEDAPVDRAAAMVLGAIDGARMLPWEPWGGDERQFNSPGFNLPIGSFSRSPAGQFPEGHTSDDNLTFVTPAALGDSLTRIVQILDILETNRVWINTSPFGEPQLGRRGLYRALGGAGTTGPMAMLWVLNLADGDHSLIDMAERSGISYAELRATADLLAEHGLLTPRS